MSRSWVNLADLPRDWGVRYSEDQPRDEDGKWTDAGGGGGSGSAAPTPSVEAAPAPAAKVAGTPKDAKPAAPAVVVAEQPTGDGGKKKAKVDDFTKDKVLLGRFVADKATTDRFIEQWDSRVGEAPAEFKKQFLGGVDSSMTLDVTPWGTWEIRGSLQDNHGNSIGTYNRIINWRDRTAESAFLQLNRGQTDKAVGKKVLAGNIEMYQKLGLDKVKVHANIDVGGYAWAKYGYVPDEGSWRSLRSDIQEKLFGSMESSGHSSGNFPDSWDEIGSHDQDNIRDAWMRSTRDEFVQSEIENWRDNGDALDQAKSDLADGFNQSATLKSYPEWALDAVEAVIKDSAEGEKLIPYTAQQILGSMSAHYDTGYSGEKDPSFDFNDEHLRDPSDAPPKEQLNLPGFKPVDASSHLTQEMRDEITTALTDEFNDKAKKDADDLDPPDYIYENVGDYQHEVWEGMSDRDRYRWAQENGDLPMLDSEDEQHDLDLSDDESHTINDLCKSDDPKAIWAIADSPKGKELLLGSDWFGSLNLKDKETMDRFNAYVGKAKVSNAVAA